MQTAPENVRLSGKNGSDRRALKTALMTVRPEGANYQ